MPDLPYRAVELLGESLRHDQRAVELAVELLDAARQVDVGADHREVEPVAGPDIAVGHGAVMQRQTGLQHRPAIRQSPVALGERAQRLRCRLQRRPARRRAALVPLLPEHRQHAVAHDLEDLAAVLADRRENAVEILVEQPDHGPRAENVRQHREVAQIDQHHRRGDRAHVAAADLPVEDQLARLAPT